MSKAKKIRQVFAVLSLCAPDGFASQGQLLEDADALVELFDEPESEPQFDLRIGGMPFEQWAADVAMNNQPWKLVCEERSVKEIFELEDECYEEAFQHAKYLMEYA